MKKPDIRKPIPNIDKVIEEWKDYLIENDWDLISLCQKLPEPFMEKWKDKLDWNYICRFQTISESFIEKWKDRIDWNSLSVNKNINWNDFSEEFFDKYNQYFDLEEINKRRPFSKGFCLKYNLDWRWS